MVAEAVGPVRLRVEAAVAAVDVREERRRQERVVERGREDAPLLVGRALDRHCRERPAPRGLRLLPQTLEVGRGRLRLEVPQRSFGARRREAHAYDDRLAGGRLVVGPGLEVSARDLAQPGLLLALDREPGRGERLREARGEVDVAVLRPAVDLTAADDRPVVEEADLRTEDAVAAVHVHEVEDHVRRVGLRERVAVDGDALGRGQLDADAAVGEPHGVVAGRRLLLGVREARAVAALGLLARAGLEGERADRGHQEDVEHVADAGAGEVRLAEAGDRGVAAVIARAPVPALGVRVGARLHHAERHRSPRVRVAVAAGADRGIGPGQRVDRTRRGRRMGGSRRTCGCRRRRRSGGGGSGGRDGDRQGQREERER